MNNENVMPGVTTGIAVGALPGESSPSGRGSAILKGIRNAATILKKILRNAFKKRYTLFEETGRSPESGGELYENGRPRYRVLQNTTN